MEISKLTQNAIRIKGKKSTLVFDVLDTKKVEASAFLFLSEDFLKGSFEKESLIISGPGEYEVSGIKISASRFGNGIAYELLVEGMKVLVVSSSTLLKMKDKVGEENIVVLFANETIDQSTLTNVQPGIVVCYGEKAKETSEILGKGLNKKEADAQSNPDAVIKPTDKFVMTIEKIPTELQVVLLG